MFKIGKLYRCSVYFLSLFPDKETAATAVPAAAVTATYAAAAATAEPATAAAYASAWTRELGKPIGYCDPKTPLLVLSVKEQYIEVLAGDKVGWIIYQDWLNIKEIDYA